MPRKKSPNKQPVQNPPVQNPPVQNPPAAVTSGNVFASFMREAQSIGQEVEARRAFDTEVGAYLKSKGLLEDFETWRKPKT